MLFFIKINYLNNIYTLVNMNIHTYVYVYKLNCIYKKKNI